MAPGGALRLALLGWGLGHRSLGHQRAATAWLLAEVIGVVLVAYTVVVFADTTWYLLPFLLGTAFIVCWVTQAVLAFRLAERRQGAIAPTPTGSPAAWIAWLTVPLLLWGTGFWLIGADGASPGAVLDRYLAGWPTLAAEEGWPPGLARDPSALTDASRSALGDLRQLCSEGKLNVDCGASPGSLLHDVRIRISDQTDDRAIAVAEAVDYEQHKTTVLFVFKGTELVPVTRSTVLRLSLQATPVAGPLGLQLGARRWQIVNAEPPAEVGST